VSALAIILARGGSKGLPGKNTACVGGRPCIAWTIDGAKASERVSRVVVSSDDPRALDIARGMEADTVDRPDELASDTATVDDAARHACESIGWTEGPVVILYANVPIRPAGLIDEAIERLGRGFDSVQSYAPVGKHHPWWTARLDEQGAACPWEGDVLNHGVYRRQDLPAAYIPDGGVIAVTREALFHRIEGVAPGPHAFLGARRGGVVTGEGEVIDIDSRVDQLVADAILRERMGLASGLSEHPPARRWRRTG
jgi:N-acylneuraminate cytidylyltransferase